MRVAISLISLGLIIIGAVMVWRSVHPASGALLIVFGLAINTIMAATRKWRTAESREAR